MGKLAIVVVIVGRLVIVAVRVLLVMVAMMMDVSAHFLVSFITPASM